MAEEIKDKMEKEIKLMEMVTILFLDGIISHHERDELLMRLQHKLNLKTQPTKEQSQKCPNVFIERAALCTIEGIRAICGTDKEYSGYVEKFKKEKGGQKTTKESS